jgi:hypothetical protein
MCDADDVALGFRDKLSLAKRLVLLQCGFERRADLVARVGVDLPERGVLAVSLVSVPDKKLCHRFQIRT